jgi:hypothetical protein
MKKTISVFITTILLNGCSSPIVSSHLAAGAIGCLSQDIKITDEDYTLETNSNEFIAECKGKKFACTYINRRSIYDPATPAVCHPLLESDNPAQSANEECEKRKVFNRLLDCSKK